MSDTPTRLIDDHAAEIEAARLLLARLGVSAEDLLRTAPTRPVPTFSEYIPVVVESVGKATRSVYSAYWRRIVAWWGQRRLDEPTPSELEQLVRKTSQRAIVRRNSRDGRSAGEHMVAALRCIYRRAEADGLIAMADNPARKIAKPRRLPSSRRAIPDTRLAEINEVACRTGPDPVRDALLLRLHSETACRRGGALALRPMDLEPVQCLIRLREKGGTTRWQPVSPTLMSHLGQHAEFHATPPAEQLLRKLNGTPITKYAYTALWQRLGEHLPWVATQQITTHWLRHTTLTWVDRNFGRAVAAEYAGHRVGSQASGGVTGIYTRATQEEVCAALSALTGEPHPLAPAA